MKALVCKSCGSSDLVKKGYYYECQYCGTKYVKDNEIFKNKTPNERVNKVFANVVRNSETNTRISQRDTYSRVNWIFLIMCFVIGLIAFAPSNPKKEDTSVSKKFTKIQKDKAISVAEKHAQWQKDKERVKQEVIYSKPVGRFSGLNDIEMLMVEGHPKVLESTESGYNFFKDMGNKKFYFYMLGDIDLFGTSSNDNILKFEGSTKNIRYIDSKERTTYITGAYLWFCYTNVKVDYKTAIKVIDTYIPKDILRKYYKLSYSNKYIRSKTIGPYYELLYVLDMAKNTKTEGLPSHFRVVLDSAIGDSMTSATINCIVYPNEEKHIQKLINKGYTITKWDYDPLR